MERGRRMNEGSREEGEAEAGGGKTEKEVKRGELS